MSSPRTPRAFAVGLLTILLLSGLAALIGPGAAQVSTYCPQGDSGPEPPSAGTAKDRLDLVLGDTTMELVPDSGGPAVPGDERGAYTIVPGGGTLNVTARVDEVGGETATGQTTLRATLGKPDGSTVARTANIAVPAASGNTTHTFQFPIGLGRHTILFHVNPNQDPAEDCTDDIPNSNCPDGGTSGCTQTYYDNNRKTVGVMAGHLPDLKVQGVAQDGPVRATAEANDDSEASFTVTIANEGVGTAFNLSELNPGAADMTLEIGVRDCSCEPQKFTLGQLAAGASKAVTTDTFALHGLTDEILLEITLDPKDWVAETNETNNIVTHNLPLPTPDLVTKATADLPREGDAFVTPKGRDLEFSVTVTNAGIGVAQNATGESFRLTVHLDSDDSTTIFDRQVTLDGLDSAVFSITAGADNFTGTHTFTVSADPDDEVFESNDANNDATLTVVVAVYEATLTVAADDRRTTVPPGVAGHIPFTLKNTGSVSDTYDLSAPSGERDRQRYLDAEGSTITEIALGPGKSFRGEVAFDINSTDPKDTEFNTTIIATSRSVQTRHIENVTYVVGPDDLAPDIFLETPTSGYLGGNQLVVRIRDNVGVTSAETDLGTDGQFVTIEPSTPDGILYTLDATGLPQEFSFRVRATDAAGNTRTEQISIIRDETVPRITSHRFTPGSGARPGDLINLVVEAADANMDRVEVSIFQKRPQTDYRENLTLQFGGGRWTLREWELPERPGYYEFNITAYDRAGNQASTIVQYTVQGLNLRIVTDRPTVTPRQPVEGQRVTFSYVIENTSPRFDSGQFLVVFGLDQERQIGIRDVSNLAPDERMVIQFSWIATPGPHDWALVVDQANEVYEDDESQADNVLQVTTGIMFPDQALFAAPEDKAGFESFGERVGRYWFVPTLMLGVAVLFTIAFVLGRRPLV